MAGLSVLIPSRFDLLCEVAVGFPPSALVARDGSGRVPAWAWPKRSRHQRSGFDGRRSMAVMPRSSKIEYATGVTIRVSSNDNV